jgi:hypothetical protein
MTTTGHIAKAMRDIDAEEGAFRSRRTTAAKHRTTTSDYWNLREIFENGEIDIDELDDKLAAQLGSIKWGVDSRGRIKIESKDDMRKRGMPSPDRADTVAMAFSRRADGGGPVDIESHAGESITGDLMTKAW